MLPKRKDPRFDVRLQGKLASPDMSQFVDCLILNVSMGGALVGSSSANELPDRLYLWQSRTHAILECEVRWRRLNLLGLRFKEGNERADIEELVDSCDAQASAA